MKPRVNLRGAAIGLAAALMLALPPAAHAGLPQPGVVIYGQVVDSEGQVLTSGDVVVSYTPTSGGDTVAVTAPLRRILGPGENYSFSIVVPVETALPGHGATPDALLLSSTPREYTRTVSVMGTNLSKVTTVVLSTADIAGVQRVDLCSGCPETLRSFHSGDTNRDQRFSLTEFLRMIELHTATPTHEYHTDKSERDGFATGTGPRTGDPHTGDYYGGANWRFTLPEVVRAIDLFAATPDHSYAPAGGTEDGFSKGRQQSRPTGLARAAMKAAEEPPAFYRVVRAGAEGLGGDVAVTVAIAGDTSGLSALGVESTLPAGWRFGALAADAAPMVSPGAGTAGTLEFAWFPVPAEGYEFGYTLDAEGADIAAALGALGGAAVFRTLDGESQFVAQLISPTAPDGLSDTDGDGISDPAEGNGSAPGEGGGDNAVEGEEPSNGGGEDNTPAQDSDGDGIPDYADADSDGDGLLDEEEAGADGDPSYNPYHPVTNPGGTDTSATSADTDGDGATDLEERDFGSNPVDPASAPPAAPGKAAGMPAAGGVALAALAGALVLAARRRRF